MSRYRPIYKEIWRDLEDFNTEDKLLFIYLLTNDAVTESGIYKISPGKISFDTSIPLPTVKQRLSNGLFKNILYDKENGVIFVKNARRYSTGGRDDLIKKSIQADYRSCSTSPLWETFQEIYPQYPLNSNGCPTVVQPYDSDDDNNNSNKEGVVGGEQEVQPEIFSFYEKNIGHPITPIELENLRDAVNTFPEDKIRYAIKEAVNANARNWRYIEKILVNDNNRKQNQPRKRNPLWEPEG